MIYKLQNEGIIKLQNAGSLPKWMQKLNSWSIPDSDESAGERILNSTIEQANDATTQEERDRIYKDSAKKNLAVTGQSLMMIPMLGEFTTYGLLGGGLRLGTGIAGSKAGEYVLGKGGDWADKKLNTKFLGTTGRIIGGLGGWWGGSSATTPLFRNLAGKGITLHMPQETFMNLRGQYFDTAVKNIKLDASVLPKLQYRDRLMKDYLEFGPDSNIYGDNVSKLVHWDPMTTGTKSALPINGGFSREPLYFPHFENGKLVPAIGQIRSKLGNGRLYAHPYHPIFFGANKPWWEVPKSNLSDMFLEATTVDKSIYSGPKQYFKRWYRRQRKYASDMRKWYEEHGPQNRSARYLITDPENLADYEFNYKLGIMGSEVPMSKLDGFEYDPLLGTFKRAKYIDPSISTISPQEAATTYHFDGRKPLTKPISFEEKLGWTKGERNQPVKQGIKSNPRYFLDSEELFPRDLVEIVPDDALVPNIYKQYMLSHKSDKHRGFDIYGWLEEPPTDHEIVINNINDFAKTLPDYDPKFAREDGNPSFYITQFRDYLSSLGYDTSDISDESVLKLLTHQYKDLSDGATDKLKGRLVFHGTDKPFESFDYHFTGKNTGNMGYNGAGNYFTTHPSAYGSKTISGFFGPKYRPGWQQPYMITGIKATPLNNGKLSPKLNIPDYISPHGGDYKSVIDRAIRMADTGAVKDMAVIDDISHYPTQLFTEEVPISEFSVARNTGIKSLFPHPSRFIRNEDGTVRLIPTDWSDIRVNYKKGGKI